MNEVKDLITCTQEFIRKTGWVESSDILHVSPIFLEVKLGTEWLKLLKNWLFSISAFCKSFVTRAELGASRAGIEDSFLVSSLNNFQNVFTSTA